MHQPHDKLFKKVFSSKYQVAQFIKNFLPKDLVEKMNLETLKLENPSFVNKNLKAFSSDIIYSVQWEAHPIYLSLLFEHKSYVVNPYPQLLTYLASFYQWQLDNKKPLSVVLPIIIYHGKDRWEKKAFYDYFELPDEKLRLFIPMFNYHLSDLNDYSDEELFQLELSAMLRMLLLFKHVGEKIFLKQFNRELFIFVKEEKVHKAETPFLREFILYVYETYKLKPEDMKDIVKDFPDASKKEFLSTYDMILIEGSQRGEKIGTIKTQLFFAIKLINSNKNWSDDLIEEFSGFSKNHLKTLRAILSTKKEQSISPFLKNIFDPSLNLKDEELLVIKKEFLSLIKH